ncbi:MAG: hypothetical protein KDE53_09215 [Caldilineaceae bacterium]|nr:hypothetical protein [Caldilineaceae bacterium]
MTVNLTPSREKLVQAAERLPLTELTDLVQDLLQMQARRQAPVLSQPEAELLQQINQGLAPEQQHRYETLIEKRLAETLTPAEHQEFMQLNQTVERINVARLKNLVALAQLRQVTLSQLMADLGIADPTYVA